MDDKSRDSELFASKNIARMPLDFGFSVINQGVILAGPSQLILATNEAFTSITGYSEDECIGRNCEFLQGPNTDLQTLEEIRKACQNATVFSGDIESYRKDGSSFWNELLVKPIFDEAGKLKFYIWIINDISKRKALEMQLSELADTDLLTKLFTRRVLQDRLSQVLLKTSRSKHHAALLFIDLDHFKRINDLFGHPAGDLRLIDVAKRLKECVREEDTVVRLGGDEFVVLVNELSPDIHITKTNVSRVAQRIVDRLSTKSCLKELPRKPCQLDDISQCQCSASVGVVLFSGKDRTASQLLDEADHAMYRAKKVGGNRYQFYEEDAAKSNKSAAITPLRITKKPARQYQEKARRIRGDYS